MNLKNFATICFCFVINVLQKENNEYSFHDIMSQAFSVLFLYLCLFVIINCHMPFYRFGLEKNIPIRICTGSRGCKIHFHDKCLILIR